MWFDSSSDIVRVILVGTAAYVLLVVLLRISGKRTLAKLNAFDLVVTVALGSTLATILLNKDVSWTEGAVALALLAALQAVVAATTARLPTGRSVVTARPTVVLRNGTMVADALRRQRMTESEVRQAIRATGIGSVSEVDAVVLESDGTLSVIPAGKLGDASALRDAERRPAKER